MKTFLKYVVAAFAMVCAFAAGAITASVRDWFQPIVHITIRNESGHHIQDLRIEHESARIKSTMTIGAMRKGESRTVRFYVSGEAGYSMEATLDDGRKITGGSGYVESGYSVTEVIHSTFIRPEDVRYVF